MRTVRGALNCLYLLPMTLTGAIVNGESNLGLRRHY